MPRSASSAAVKRPTMPAPTTATSVPTSTSGPRRPVDRLEQLEPDLAAGREGGNGVTQPRDRHLADHRDGRRVQEVGYLRADDRGADEHAALLVDQEPGRPRRAAAVERATRVAGRRRVDDPWPEPRPLRRLR